MSNDINNVLKLSGNQEDIDKVLNFIKYDNYGIGSIDFNKITPMPPWVLCKNGVTCLDEEKYGKENTSLGWKRKNWGTKWNAYVDTFDKDNNTLYFTTPWNGVPDLIWKLSFIFPDITFYYSWQDEFSYEEDEIYEFKDAIINKIK